MTRLPAVHRAYVASSYPHNHDYWVLGRHLVPRYKLWRRWRRLRRLWPKAPSSLLDIGCSKGFFVLAAAREHSCERALGTDVFPQDLDTCRAMAAYLGLEKARFESLFLDRLAERIGDFGGPFETTMLVNVYPYLFFGSRRSEACLATHAEIFACLAKVTAKQLIFSNRLEVQRFPRNVQVRAEASGRADEYNEAAILQALEPHFTLERRGKLGRIPLWRLEKRAKNQALPR